MASRQAQHDVARGNQHSGRAEATLQAVLFRKSAPQRAIMTSCRKPSIVRTDGAVAHHRIGDAGACRVAVQQQGARTARALLAPQMRGRQVKLLSKEIGKMRARLHGFGQRRPFTLSVI